MTVEKIYRLNPQDILMIDVNHGREYANNFFNNLLCEFIKQTIRPYMEKKNLRFTVIRETPVQLTAKDNDPYGFVVFNGLVGNGLRYLLTMEEAKQKVNKHWFDYRIQISFDD